MHLVLKRIVHRVSPSYVHSFSKRPFFNSIFFFSKVLLAAFLIMLLFYIPDFVSLPAFFERQMAKFKTLSIDGKFTVSAPVYFPSRDGILVIDSTGMHTRLQDEFVLVTNEKLHYRWFRKEHAVEIGKFSNVVENKENFKVLFMVLIIFVVPSLLAWSYLFFWVKYFFSIIFLGTIFFVLFDLTHFRKSWKQMINVSVYASMIPILGELVSLPISTVYLVPFVRPAGINFYLVPIIVQSVIIVIFTFVAHRGEHKEHDSR